MGCQRCLWVVMLIVRCCGYCLRLCSLCILNLKRKTILKSHGRLTPQSWVIARSDKEPHKRRDWCTLHRTLLRRIYSTIRPDCSSHLSKRRQTKLFKLLHSHHAYRRHAWWLRHVCRMNTRIAILPMFVAEYFPQFRGNWCDFSLQCEGSTLVISLGVEFQSCNDRYIQWTRSV